MHKNLFCFTIKLFLFLVIITSSFTIKAECTCSALEKKIKNNFSDSMNKNLLIFSGTVEDIIMIDESNYLAKIKISNIWKNISDNNELIEQEQTRTIISSLLFGRSRTKQQNNKTHTPHTPKDNPIDKNDGYFYAVSSKDMSSCNFSFNIGWNYLIYGRISDDVVVTSKCSRTGIVNKLLKDIEQLNQAIKLNNKNQNTINENSNNL